jgi:membrane-associated phospholipid phosphatase
LGSATASIVLLHRYDKAVQEYSQDEGLLRKDVARLLDLYGGGWAYPLTLLGIGITSFWQNNDKAMAFHKFEYVITSFEVTVIITNLLKWSVGRERPNKQSTTSFPSGHTSGSFVVAATMDELYGFRVGLPAYVIAGLVGIERIHDNKHWLTDVFAGAALGTVIGRGFGIVYHNKLTRSPLVLTPIISNRNIYVSISVCLN